jgi:hypothetical protein
MNNMHKYIVKFNKKLLINLALILSIIFSLSCVDGASDKQVVTVNPFGVGIIVFNSIPLQLFGNGTDIDTIKVNTGLIPNGSTITARITGTDIQLQLKMVWQFLISYLQYFLEI